MNKITLVASIALLALTMVGAASAQDSGPIRGTFVGADPTNTELQTGGVFFSNFNAATLWFDRSGNDGAFDNTFALTGGNSGSSTTGTGGYQAGSGDIGIVTTITGLTAGEDYAIDFIHTTTFNASSQLPYSVGFSPDSTTQVDGDTVFAAWLSEVSNTSGVRVWGFEVGTATADDDGEIQVYVNLLPASDTPPNVSYTGLQAYNGVSFTPVESVLLGDVNMDETVDFLDIVPFIGQISSGEFKAEADIDGSTTVDFLDIVPFIALLSQ